MSSPELDEILDHYRNPRNYGEIENPDIHAKDSNPLCGDVVELFIRVKDGVISDVKFKGKGCAISQASASKLTEKLIGMRIEDVKSLSRQDILEMLGIELSPVRLKCALLSLKVLKVGVYSYLGQRLEQEEAEK
ncbi:MAG: iron-sulfur cluster assembly scaffold protein [Nitrososphaerota archaeon]